MSTTTRDGSEKHGTRGGPGADPVARLAARKDAWVRVGIPERVALLARCRAGVMAVAEEWVRLGCEAKGIPPDSPAAGEEWVTGPMTLVRGLRLFESALADGAAPRPHGWAKGPRGETVARVFPGALLERLAFTGLTAEIWFAPGTAPTQGRLYREKERGSFRAGKVALVLGAGNISSIGPLDVLHKLLVDDEVAVLKTNPVNGYLAPVLRRALAPLVEEGFVEIVTGGGAEGDALCRDPRVGSIHLTGSSRTHDAIVWGADPGEAARRRAASDPAVAKPVTAELGCVTPVLVVPGRWTAGDLEFQARHVAAMVAHNASFNCTAGKVLLLARAWPQREAFLERVAAALAAAPPRRAYYPGAAERYHAFLGHYPQARALGRTGEGVLPWTLIPDVPARPGEYALTEEAFCGVIAEVAIDAAGPAEYVDRAVAFANESIWGTLSAVVLVPPSARRESPGIAERAISGLRYGSVGLNVWTGVNFALGVTSWGAYPGHTPADVVSGIGAVHNTFLFDSPEKSVVRGPFRMFPKPIWFADHRTLRVLGRRLVAFENEPSWLRLPGLAWAALRG
jgi:hypothetical protein